MRNINFRSIYQKEQLGKYYYAVLHGFIAMLTASMIIITAHRTLQIKIMHLKQQIIKQNEANKPTKKEPAFPTQKIYHANTIALVATTLPQNTWLTKIQLTPEKLKLQGNTTNPAAVFSWRTKLLHQLQQYQNSTINLSNNPLFTLTLSKKPYVDNHPQNY